MLLLLPFAEEADNDAPRCTTRRRTVAVFAVIAHYKISSVFFFFFLFFAFCATIWLYYRDFFFLRTITLCSCNSSHFSHSHWLLALMMMTMMMQIKRTTTTTTKSIDGEVQNVGSVAVRRRFIANESGGPNWPQL